jgi:hypothetical protein
MCRTQVTILTGSDPSNALVACLRTTCRASSCVMSVPTVSVVASWLSSATNSITSYPNDVVGSAPMVVGTPAPTLRCFCSPGYYYKITGTAAACIKCSAGTRGVCASAAVCVPVRVVCALVCLCVCPCISCGHLCVCVCTRDCIDTLSCTPWSLHFLHPRPCGAHWRRWCLLVERSRRVVQRHRHAASDGHGAVQRGVLLSRGVHETRRRRVRRRHRVLSTGRGRTAGHGSRLVLRRRYERRDTSSADPVRCRPALHRRRFTAV